jgi:Zn-dependent protease
MFDTAYFLAWVVAFFTGIVIHNYSQAFLAYRLGDNSGRKAGFMRLNLQNHHDPFGLLLAVLLSVQLGFSGVAWGKPVPINRFAVKGGRLGNFLVVIVGPLANLLVAFLLALAFGGFIKQNFQAVGFTRPDSVVKDLTHLSYGSLLPQTTLSGVTDPAFFLARFLFYLILVNIYLFAFNLYIPFGPLDGYRNLINILPSQWEVRLQFMETFGPYFLIALIFVVPFVIRISLIGLVVNPVVAPILNLFGLPVPVWIQV